MRGNPLRAIRGGQDDSRYAFGVAGVQQVWIAGGERPRCPSGRLGRDAVSHADGAPAPVVAAGSEPARGMSQVGVNDDALEQTELCQVEGCGFFVGTDKPDEVIDDLGYPDCRQGRIAVGQQRPDLSGGGLGL